MTAMDRTPSEVWESEAAAAAAASSSLASASAEESGSVGWSTGRALLRSPLGATLGPPGGDGAFHLASMQFALHYMFQSLPRARTFFRDLSSWLAPGAQFVATTVSTPQARALDKVVPSTRKKAT